MDQRVLWINAFMDLSTRCNYPTCWAASDGATCAYCVRATCAYCVSTSTVAALQLEPHQAWRGPAARRYAKCCEGGAIAAGPANCTRVAQLLCLMVCSMRQETGVPDRSSSATRSRVSTHTKNCSRQSQWSQVAGPPEQLAAVLSRGTFAWRCPTPSWEAVPDATAKWRSHREGASLPA